MKLSRKLLPALAMLLVSAVMMSTASFAWFSTNTTAKADGFTVQIAAAKTILIKDSADADTAYATSKTYTDTKNMSMAPVSANKPEDTTDGTVATPTFYMVKQGGAGGILPGNAGFIAGAGADKTVFETTTSNYITKTVSLRATGSGETLGKMTLEIDTTPETVTADSINESLRVMVAVKDGDNVKWYLYAPYGGEAIKPVIGYDDATGGKTTEQVVALTSNAAPTDIVAAVAPETEYQVTFYIWFEGQDPTCFANNAVKLSDIDLKFSFNLVEVVGD